MNKEIWNRVIVGDDTGLLKDLAFSPDDDSQAPKLLNTWGIQAPESSVTKLTVASEGLITYMRGSKTIELLNTLTGSVEASLEVPTEVGRVVTMRLSSETLIYVSSNGYLIQIDDWCSGATAESRSKLPTERVDCAVWSEEDLGWFVSRNDSPNPQLIVGGKVTWTGKNQPDTKLGVTAKFEATSLLPLGPLLLAADVEGQLRVYNYRIQRKASFEIKNVFAHSSNQNHASNANARVRPVTCLVPLEDGKTVLCADTMGTLVAVDISSQIVKHGFRGIMGSIRDVRLSGSDLYCVSAGRHVYKLNAVKHRKAPVKLFLKQKLTCVCVLPDIEVEVERPRKKQRSSDSDEDEEDEEDEEDQSDEEEEGEETDVSGDEEFSD